MPRQPLKFSYDNHLTLGIEVRQARNVLRKIVLKVVNNTPKQGEIRRAAERAERAFDNLRSVLESTVVRDFPEREFRGIYLGDQRASVQVIV